MTLDRLKRNETWILAGLSLALLAGMTPILGVWEPWESDVASAIDLMIGDGSWWLVQLPGAGEGTRAVAELPFGLWPSAALASLIGTNEWSLRLPGVLLGVAVVLLGFGVLRRQYGRGAAWLGAIGLLSMPMFVFHTRLAFGTAVGMQCSALAALAILHLMTAPEARLRWRILAWTSLAFAGLAAGVVGLAGPLGALAAAGWVRAQAGERPEAGALSGLARQALLVIVIASVGLFGFGLTFWGAIVAGGGAALLLILALIGPVGRAMASALLRPGAAGPIVAVSALGLLLGGWALAWQALPEEQSIRALLLWINDFDGPGSVAQRPGFDDFVHQIGFGLFPLGAFVPLAFADVVWNTDAQSAAQRGLVLGATGWFALGFLTPALGMPFSHVGFFFAAPAVAIAIGIYFQRALTSPPQPLLVVVAVLLVALLDSNLKHQTQALADTLVGTKVDAFPPKLAWWSASRVLSFALLGVLILFQGGAIGRVKPLIANVFYPTRRPRLFEGWVLFWAVGLAGAGALVVAVGRMTLSGRTYVFRDFVTAGTFWQRLVIPMRWLLLLGVLLVVGYALVWLVWRVRAARLAGSREGLIMTITGRLVDAFGAPTRAIGLLGAVLLAWAGLMNLGVTSAMTTNFSQKEIISRYAELKSADEPLMTYDLDPRNSSFYARSLDVLDRQAFRERIPAADRLFAIIPRKNLASINKDFRALTGRTMPVLDDRGYRFLLISNQLRDGEVDYNPITRALISELPPGVTKTNHVFDDRIELVGWKLDPATPRPGAELTMSLFWRAKKAISGRWKVFVHIDAPGQRIHGDHDPVEGMFPTDNWKPGDLIRDDHRIIVKRTVARNNYTFYVGLFRGGTRMPITVGDKDQENRAKIGRVRVQ